MSAAGSATEAHSIEQHESPIEFRLTCRCGWSHRETRRQNAFARAGKLKAAANRHLADVEAADLAPYRIRERTRRQASPPPGHRQEWHEAQVVLDGKVIGRHDFHEQAVQQIRNLKAALRSTVDKGDNRP